MIVLDASAIIKLVVREEHSESVRKQISEAIVGGDTIAAPDIALPEALNGIWRHVALLKDVGRSEVPERLAMLTFIWEKIIHINSSDLAEMAITIGIDSKLTVYDSLYIAASLINNAQLLTFDGEMAKRAKKLKVKVL